METEICRLLISSERESSQCHIICKICWLICETKWLLFVSCNQLGVTFCFGNEN